jgi:hypothetical protein
MSSFNERRTVVIIEPRKHRAFPFVIKNILDNLSELWDIQIFTGLKNTDFVKDIISQKFNSFSDRIFITEIDVENLTTKEYTQLMTDISFINTFRTETVLLMQMDSMIIPQNKSNINLFLDYDYVGAPWPSDILGGHSNIFVGNGGFSLRKKSVMIHICKYYNMGDWDAPEDVFYALRMVELKKNIPSAKNAEFFSSEMVLNSKSLGIHNIWRHFVMDKIKEVYPESFDQIQTLANLQKHN